MLTFARGPVHLVYSRSTLDRAGLWASGLALLALCCFAFIPRRMSIIKTSGRVVGAGLVPARTDSSDITLGLMKEGGQGQALPLRNCPATRQTTKDIADERTAT